VFLINSRYPLFCATRHWLPIAWPSLSRSYRCNLQSSFTIFLSSALVYSTHLPVSVCGTIYICELFPGTFAMHNQSNKIVHPKTFVTSQRYRNINLFPIGYAFQLDLRVSTNPTQINFTLETLDFRRRCV